MNENKKWIFFALVCMLFSGIASIFWLWSEKTSFSQEYKTQEDLQAKTSQENIEVIIFKEPYSNYSLFSPSLQKELLKRGIRLKYEDVEESQQVQHFNDNKALYIMTTNQFLSKKPKGKIITPISSSVGADALFINNKKCPIQSLKDLNKNDLSLNCRGITYAKNSTSQDLFNLLLAGFEEYSFLKLNPRPVSNSKAALEVLRSSDNTVGAAILQQPEIDSAISEGYTLGVTSKEFPRSLVNVLVASDSLMEKHPEAIKNFLRAYYRNIEQIKQNNSFFTDEIVTTDPQLSAAQAQSVVSGTSFFTADSAKTFLTLGDVDKHLAAAAASLVLNGELSDVPTDLQSYYDSHFIREVVEDEKKLHDLIKANEPKIRKQEDLQSETSATVEPKTALGTLEVRGKIQFKSDSPILDATSQKTLDGLAEQIKNIAGVGIEVIGHTSKRGNEFSNLKLSQSRALAVKNALVERGVKAEIIAVGKGSSQPLPGISPQSNANQRTEILVTTK